MRTILSRDGLRVADVACRHEQGVGETIEQAGGHVVVFVRRGCFVRRADGAAALMDPSVAYCMNAGEEQRYDHPHDGGDDCTSLFFDADVVARLWGGDPVLPTGPLPVSARLDLGHRLLLAADGRNDDHQLYERALALAAGALEGVAPQRVAAGRPATARARAALADGAREALVADRDLSLPELARLLADSPHHLSRIFHAATGATISRYRVRLRVRDALDRLAGGEHDLARLAADTGFADHSHLCRSVRGETGHTPSALAQLLT
jgi:AraC-like DNA-binding protein